MHVCKALQPFGSTIFSTMSALAREHNAINLSQGFPDFDGPEFVKEAAIEAIRAGHGQYPPSQGIPELRRAISEHFHRYSGLPADPDTCVTTTNGCTEAIASTLLGLLNPGDEVVVFEPYYDSYRACIAMGGGTPRFVTMRAPDFRWDPDELAGAFNDKTRAVMLNTPHNPTGRVLTREELQQVADLCHTWDAICISDEVYEHLVFQGEHVSIASLDGMWDRTITLSSFGKTFGLTGWKLGWAIAQEELTRAVRAAHQFVTFASVTPMQHAAARALSVGDEYYDRFTRDYLARRDMLCEGLESLGFGIARPEGTYFVLADHSPFGFEDDVAFCTHLVEKTGVAAIPPSAFYEHPEFGQHLVRFAFCKREETLRAALERLARLRD
ncbi:MAG: methionine aminotransferase [Planctomycetota bacterium]|jgi:aspartate/methionine/tyrosine aminotransferase